MEGDCISKVSKRVSLNILSHTSSRCSSGEITEFAEKNLKISVNSVAEPAGLRHFLNFRNDHASVTTGAGFRY